MKSIDDYEYDERDIIERGSFGNVYRGRLRLKTLEKVAVKVINKINAEKMEIDKLKSLDCINVVKLLHSKTIENDVFLIMEQCYLRLDNYVRQRGGGFDELSLHKFLLDTANGLKYIHMKCMIHGDIQPSNIYFNYIVYKIAYFGMTVKREQTFYAAPDLNQNDCKIDVYSLGKTACFTLTKNERDLRCENAPENIKLLILKMIESDPNVRIGVEEILQYLNQISPITAYSKYSSYSKSWLMPVNAKVLDLKRRLASHYRNDLSSISLSYGSADVIDDKLLKLYDNKTAFILKMSLNVSINDGHKKYKFQVTSDTKIEQLKNQYLAECNKDDTDIVLEYQEQILEYTKELCQYEIPNNAILICTVRQDTFNVWIAYRDQTFIIPVTGNTKVRQLKNEFSKKTGFAVYDITFTFNGVTLKDEDTMASYEIYNNATLMWMTRLPGASTRDYQ